MIRQFNVENYKALRSVSLDLSPMSLLIGPNDSGKSSVLEALAALCRSVDMPLARAFGGRWVDAELVWQRDAGLEVTLGASFDSDPYPISYTLSCTFSRETTRESRLAREGVRHGDAAPLDIRRGHISETSVSTRRDLESVDGNEHTARETVHAALSGVRQYRWVPEHLALPTMLDSGEPFTLEPTGFGLARCLDDLLGIDRSRFDELERRFAAYFPEVANILLVREPAYARAGGHDQPVLITTQGSGKGIHFALSGSGVSIPASQASDGTLLVLAYLTVLYMPQPPRALLIEEPENGVHPKRLQDVLKIVRELVEGQQHTQVIMTTHSPYVLDLFTPSEVILCGKQLDGAVVVTRLSDSEVVAQQSGVFTLGEIWTAEGDDALARRGRVAS